LKTRASEKGSSDIKRMKRRSTCKRSCFCRFNLASLGSNNLLASFKSKNRFHDIMLMGNDSDEMVGAHKMVLLNLGYRFPKMNSQRALEPNTHQTLKLDAPFSVVKDLVNYAYNGKLNLVQENIDGILSFAADLEIPGVLKLCGDFIKCKLKPSNALKCYHLAKEFLCTGIQEYIKKFILHNFQMVSIHDKNFGDCPSPILEDLVKDDELNVSEEQLFSILVKWTDQDIHRQDILPDLIKHIRFALMNQVFFEANVETSSILSNKVIAKQIAHAKSFFLRMTRARSTTLTLFPRMAQKPRIPNEIVFVIGGWSAEPNGPTDCVETFDIRSYKWNTLKLNAPSPRAYHGLAVANKKVYLFGGYDGDEYFSAMTCYDPVARKWDVKAPMYHARCYVSVTVLEDKIYAIGGFNGRNRLKSIECYDPMLNLWTLLPPMRIVRSDACAVAYSGKVYVIGGFTGEEILDSVEVFDPVTKEWSFGPRLNTVRSGVKSVVYQNKIFVLGGFDGRSRLKSVECLDINDTNNYGWTYVSELRTQRSNFALTVVDDKILVMGGFEGHGVVNKTEAYCGHTDSWTSYPPMVMQRSALSAITLSGLPNPGFYVNRSGDSV